MRLGLNLGPGMTTAKVEGGGLSGPESDISGFTSGFDLLLGGTVTEGLVLGGGLLTTYASNPTVKVGSFEADADGTLILAGVTGFAQYYFDPANGGHLQALLGYGALSFEHKNGTSGGNDPGGVLLGIGGGYDFWVSDEWSIGPFARILYGSLSAESGAATQKDTYLYPSIGAAFTLH
ncbi:MAG: autotransporter domain-containing protein [Deltaproteobacteria bacterium]|nr:autotransporter domain-containing protein [Deltaproteobacteria bacterium]